MVTNAKSPAAGRADGARKSDCLPAVDSEIIRNARQFQQNFVAAVAAIDPAALAALAFLAIGEALR